MTPFQIYLAISVAPLATMVTVLVGILVNNSVMNAHVRRLDEKIDDRFARLDEKIDDRFARLDEKMDSRTETLNAHLRRVEDMLLGKFAELDNRLTRIEGHLNPS